MLTQEDRIKLLGFRVRHDINQLHFSRGIISRNQLSNIENGKSNTTEKVLFALYLRFCEYMIALDDYNRFDFESLKNSVKYKNLQEVLNLYDDVCTQSHTIEDINHINLKLNQWHFGLLNTFVLEKIGDECLAKGDRENAFLFYLKGYYKMTSCHIDEINITYMIKFLSKITQLGIDLNRSFNVIEIIDHLDHLKASVRSVEWDKDYLYQLALSHYQLGLYEKAMEICKRVELINFNNGRISRVILAKTYYLASQIQSQIDTDENSRKYHDKAIKVLREEGLDEETFAELRVSTKTA